MQKFLGFCSGQNIIKINKADDLYRLCKYCKTFKLDYVHSFSQWKFNEMCQIVQLNDRSRTWTRDKGFAIEYTPYKGFTCNTIYYYQKAIEDKHFECMYSMDEIVDEINCLLEELK